METNEILRHHFQRFKEKLLSLELILIEEEETKENGFISLKYHVKDQKRNLIHSGKMTIGKEK